MGSDLSSPGGLCLLNVTIAAESKTARLLLAVSRLAK
jgi:hypothetical protein